MTYIAVDTHGLIRGISDRPFQLNGSTIRHVSVKGNPRNWLGRRMVEHKDKLRVALVCNWDQPCGISTYSRFLANALRPCVGELRIFSEHGCEPGPGVDPCWKRGENLSGLLRALRDYDPDFVIIQHEFGIFPKATHWLTFLEGLAEFPYMVVLHSVYEHLDKSICTSAIREIVVHTDQGKNVLRGLGNTSGISVIPHGCIDPVEGGELWNIFQQEYVAVQAGFGFSYKGVDNAIRAIALLKSSQEKYKDIFYVYLCSENPHTRNVHQEYLRYLGDLVDELGVRDNVAIVRKFHSEAELASYFRTAKLALFPYITDPNNTVYGASGAIRFAMAHGIPVIASPSHLFDDFPGPRPNGPEELAAEIDKVFSSWEYKRDMLRVQDEFIREHTWAGAARSYVEVMNRIRGDSVLAC